MTNVVDQQSSQEKHTYPEYPLLPVKGMILFPNMPSPLAIGKRRSITLMNAAMQEGEDIVVAGIKPEGLEKEEPGAEDLYRIGTLARTYKMLKLHENYYQVIVQGIERVRIHTFTQDEPFLKAQVESIMEDRTSDQEVEALGINLRKLFDRYLELENSSFPVELFTSSESHPADLAYLVATHTNIDVSVQQELLEIDDIKSRLRRLITVLTKKLEKMLV